MRVAKVNPMLMNFFLLRLENVAAQQDNMVPPSLSFSNFKSPALGKAALALRGIRGSLKGGAREKYRRKN